MPSDPEIFLPHAGDAPKPSPKADAPEPINLLSLPEAMRALLQRVRETSDSRWH